MGKKNRNEFLRLDELVNLVVSLNTGYSTYKTKERIIKISNSLNINTYFFDGPSEANNLGGEFNVFLNKNQTKNQLWSDFIHKLALILIYNEGQLYNLELTKDEHDTEANKFKKLFCSLMEKEESGR